VAATIEIRNQRVLRNERLTDIQTLGGYFLFLDWITSIIYERAPRNPGSGPVSLTYVKDVPKNAVR
jgi:hypothetical protein